MTNNRELPIKNESINVKKAKYFFLQNPIIKGNISYRLPNLTISNHKRKREEPINFLEVLTDENLTWKKH